MNLESKLASVPPQEWITDQAVIFDWYDGPREGVVRLASPECEFFFKLLSEQPTDDDMDDRLFRINEIPLTTVSSILNALRTLGEPTGVVWIPVWQFASDQYRLAAERRVNELLASQRETDVVIWTRDMQHFLGCWDADRNGTPESNWFAKLGIAS